MQRKGVSNVLSVEVLATEVELVAALRGVADWSSYIDLAYAWASSGEGTANHWKALPLGKVRRAILGVHFNRTEPFVLRQLHALRVLRVIHQAGGVFHPKLLVASNGSTTRIVIGSSNFTSGGFGENTEVNLMLAGPQGNEVIRSLVNVFDEAWGAGVEPDDSWLARYERAYRDASQLQHPAVPGLPPLERPIPLQPMAASHGSQHTNQPPSKPNGRERVEGAPPESHVDLNVVYEILLTIVRTKDTITYQELSDAYFVRADVRVERRRWGTPLGQVSRRCTEHALPPISSIVVSETDKMPGDGYWGIPGAPRKKDWNAWDVVCRQVYAATWPTELP